MLNKWLRNTQRDQSSTKETESFSTLLYSAGRRNESERLRRHRRSWFSLWTLEIFASILSVTCVVCMVAFLAAIDAKPYNSWRVGHIHMTPNSLLSILATLSKSSLLLVVAETLGQLKWTYFQQRPQRLYDLQIFDDASRGPLGAAQLLWKINVQALVASAGAVVTILTLAIDPLTQQVLSFPTAWTPSHNVTASINTAKVFDPDQWHLELRGNRQRNKCA